jgi:hypothetical protein
VRSCDRWRKIPVRVGQFGHELLYMYSKPVGDDESSFSLNRQAQWKLILCRFCPGSKDMQRQTATLPCAPCSPYCYSCCRPESTSPPPPRRREKKRQALSTLTGARIIFVPGLFFVPGFVTRYKKTGLCNFEPCSDLASDGDGTCCCWLLLLHALDCLSDMIR